MCCGRGFGSRTSWCSTRTDGPAGSGEICGATTGETAVGSTRGEEAGGGCNISTASMIRGIRIGRYISKRYKREPCRKRR